MNSESNLTQMQGGPDGSANPVVKRRLLHNTRRWIAEKVYENAAHILQQPADSDEVDKLQSLMVNFGDLNPEGKHVVGTSDPGKDDNVLMSDRDGFVQLPGVGPGVIGEAFSLDALLESEYWK